MTDRLLPTDKQSNAQLAARLLARSSIMELDGDYVIAGLLFEAARRLDPEPAKEPA